MSHDIFLHEIHPALPNRTNQYIFTQLHLWIWRRKQPFGTLDIAKGNERFGFCIA